VENLCIPAVSHSSFSRTKRQDHKYLGVICGLPNDALFSSQYKALNGRMNNEFKGCGRKQR
jgi:hypothetical protein